MKTLKTILLFVVISVSSITYAQTNEKFIGIKSTAGQEDFSNPTINLGVFYEHQFAKYFAYNCGMDYKHTFNTYGIPYSVSYVSIPLNMKFVSNYVNVGLGINLDYTAGIHVGKNTVVSSTSINNLTFGTSLQLSKDIHLAKHFIIEPEAALTYVPSYEGFDYKLGFKVKYQIPGKFKSVK